MQIDMMVNGKPLMEFGGLLLREYDVQDCVVENNTYKGRLNTSYTWLGGTVGLKEVRIEIAFFGHDRHEATWNKSRFAGAIYGKVELFLPDGYFYTSILTDSKINEWIAEQGVVVQYTFKAMQHGAYEEFPSGSGTTDILCRSTVPFTDCIMSYTVPVGGSTTYNFNVNGSRCAQFKNLAEGDVCVLDGINKRLLKNGDNYAASVTLTKFPQLVPGLNTKNASSTAGYYPVYM